MEEAVAPAVPGASPLARMGQDIARDEQLYTRRSGDLAAKSAAIAAGREETLAPMEKSMTAALGEPYPERKKVEIPQFKPEPVIDAKDYEKLSYGLIAMAMIGGVASKGKWLEVGDALNGALSGYLKGNQEVAAKRYRDYEEGFKGAMAKEAQANKEFTDILSDKKMRIADQISQYRIVAAKYDRQDALVAAQSRSLDAMWRSIESRKTAMTRLEESHQRATEAMNLRRELSGKKDSGAAGLSERYSSDPQYKKNVDYWANYVQQGNSLPPRFAQSGAGKVMMPDILQVVPTLGGGNPADMAANKISLREMTAEAQKIGTQSASVAIANKELARFSPVAQEASDNVPRSAWRPLNQLLQAGENTWSPEQKKLVIANRAVTTAYAQLIQRGAPTVHSSEEAEKILLTADSPKVYKAALEQLKVEGEQAELGLKDVHDDLRKRIQDMGKGGGKDAAPTPKNQPKLTNAKGWGLHTDAAGNQAYVGPNNEIEEVGKPGSEIKITPRK